MSSSTARCWRSSRSAIRKRSARSQSARSRRSRRRPLPDRRLRLVRRLAQAKQREKLGLFVVEGEDLVAAARTAGIEPVDVLVAGEDVSPDELGSVSSLAHPPRVLAVFRRDDLRRHDPPPLGIGLWHVGDPGNVGALIRTADALGPAFVALSRGCADPTGPKAVRASMGSLFRVALVDFEEAPRPWVALVPRGGDPLAPLASGTLVLGGEREGVPPELLERCDAAQTIPLAADAESLNVAAAGAIALYEARRATKIVSSPSVYGRRSNQP